MKTNNYVDDGVYDWKALHLEELTSVIPTG
jgi:hypothetical protein